MDLTFHNLIQMATKPHNQLPCFCSCFHTQRGLTTKEAFTKQFRIYTILLTNFICAPFQTKKPMAFQCLKRLQSISSPVYSSLHLLLLYIVTLAFLLPPKQDRSHILTLLKSSLKCHIFNKPPPDQLSKVAALRTPSSSSASLFLLVAYHFLKH